MIIRITYTRPDTPLYRMLYQFVSGTFTCGTQGGFTIYMKNHFQRKGEFDDCIWFYYLDPSKPYVKAVLDSNFSEYRTHKFCVGDLLEIKILHEFKDLVCPVGVFPETLAEELYKNSKYNTHPIVTNQITVKLCIDQMSRCGMYDTICKTDTNDLSPHMFVFKVLDMMKMCGMQPMAEELVKYVGYEYSSCRADGI